MHCAGQLRIQLTSQLRVRKPRRRVMMSLLLSCSRYLLKKANFVSFAFATSIRKIIQLLLHFANLHQHLPKTPLPLINRPKIYSLLGEMSPALGSNRLKLIEHLAFLVTFLRNSFLYRRTRTSNREHWKLKPCLSLSLSLASEHSSIFHSYLKRNQKREKTIRHK